MKTIIVGILILVALVACGKQSLGEREQFLQACTQNLNTITHLGLADDNTYCSCMFFQITSRWDYEEYKKNVSKYDRELLQAGAQKQCMSELKSELGS